MPNNTLDVIITKKDEVYAQVYCNAAIQQELNDFFSFFEKGYQYMPQYKQKDEDGNRKWDGKRRLFSTRTNQIYLGLVPYIERFCQKREYEYENRCQNVGKNLSLKDAHKFYNLLKIPFPKDEKYDYQIKAFKDAVNEGRAVVLSPTGSGKTMITYLLASFYNKKIIIIVPTTGLLKQTKKKFIEYSKNNGLFNEDDIHLIYSGQEKITDQKVVISTWQSVWKLNKKYFEEYDVLVGDEAHTFTAKSLISLMKKTTKMKYKIGVSGTLSGMKLHKLILEGLFGRIIKTKSTKELIDDKVLNDFTIKVIVLHHKNVPKMDHIQREYEYLIDHEKRNKFIKNLVLDQKENTIALFGRVEKHILPLYDELIDQDTDKQIFYIDRYSSADDLEDIKELMEEKNNVLLIATYKKFSTGHDISNLHNIVCGFPTKSDITIAQSIGRGLRLFKGKHMILYDIADDFGNDNYTYKHMQERLKLYKKEKFRVKIIHINI